jgi:hypothetical protein
MGFHRILLFLFREHYRRGFTYSNANSHTQSNAYADTNRDSYANSYADSGAGHNCHQSRYFGSTGKPQL